MDLQFRKHYTRDEARALLPQLREWLETLDSERLQLHKYEQRLIALMEPGCDIGGETVNGWIRTLVGMRQILAEFQRRQIVIKDIERGLLDFPAIIGGKEVFLCWEKDEEDIEFWHDMDAGYAGRERL
jgi:hypothetical protein